MAKLSPEQQNQVESWAEAGANLNDIQSRLKAVFGISLTYLDARMLMIEAGVRLKEKTREVPQPVVASEPVATEEPMAEDWSSAVPSGGSVSVTADETPALGSVASGRATFSDGVTAVWFVDESGRLGLKAPSPGYQPPPEDIPVFEQQLDALLQSL